MRSQFPSEQSQQDDVLHALDVSLVAVQVALDTLAKVQDGDERLEMATTLHRELEELRAMVRQLEASDTDDSHHNPGVPPPRRP